MPSPETVLVIGGQGGIGSAVCQLLLQQGHKVIATSRRIPTAKNESGTPAIRPLEATLDLQSPRLREDLKALVDRFPDISTVIHCAGQNQLASVTGLDDDALERLLTVNLRSAMSVGAVFTDVFRQHKGGTLLFVGSMLGQIGVPGYSAYSASKFGLRGYTEALRREVSHHGIDVLLVSPRATRTSMNSATANQLNEQLGNQQDDPLQVATRIVEAWNRRRARTWLGWPERFFAWLNSNFPFLVDRALSRQAITVEAHLVSGGHQ